MDPDLWQRASALFHAALARQPHERKTFLDKACGDDPELRREVNSLLESHVVADDFIERPAFEVGAELMQGRQTVRDAASAASALIGQRLGPYEVQAILGRGGMGVVYLAQDTRLDRQVAIKALAGRLGRDQRSRERLRREAKAAAALSHPGIATVFALEEFEDHLYIVSEYVEGATVREELIEGALAGRALLGTALAMARALEAAHGLGIVHRDFKPENVIRARDGGIKILDFGLASFQASPEPIGGATDDNERLTRPGMLLGTPSYMAPEQLKGREVDFRADLFSFGVFLYEMATAVHPFEGDDPASTIARILAAEPLEADGATGAIPARLAPILRTLLQKEPEHRYAATSELVHDLERVASDLAPASIAAERTAQGGSNFRTEVGPGARRDAFWWWHFHQLALAAVYGASFYCLWWVKPASASGSAVSIGAVLLYSAVVPVIVAGSLRIHLAFASRYYPEHLTPQRKRAFPWIRRAELLYALILFGGGVLAVEEHPLVAVLMLAVAAGVVVLSRMIEPTTIRAAFPHGE